MLIWERRLFERGAYSNDYGMHIVNISSLCNDSSLIQFITTDEIFTITRECILLMSDLVQLSLLERWKRRNASELRELDELGDKLLVVEPFGGYFSAWFLFLQISFILSSSHIQRLSSHNNMSVQVDNSMTVYFFLLGYINTLVVMLTWAHRLEISKLTELS